MCKRGRFYIIEYPTGIIFRNIWTGKGKKFEPMIQMQAEIEGKWPEIIRCDRSPHPTIHYHFFCRNGKKKGKPEALHSQDPIDAIGEAMDRIKRDWKLLFEEEFPELVERYAEYKESINSELDNAKRFLLEEAKHPERIEDMRGIGARPYSATANFLKISLEAERALNELDEKVRNRVYNRAIKLAGEKERYLNVMLEDVLEAKELELKKR